MSASPFFQMNRKEQQHKDSSSGRDMETIANCGGRVDPRITATPPQSQRRFFSQKLKSPFNKRRMGLKANGSNRILSGECLLLLLCSTSYCFVVNISSTLITIRRRSSKRATTVAITLQGLTSLSLASTMSSSAEQPEGGIHQEGSAEFVVDPFSSSSKIFVRRPGQKANEKLALYRQSLSDSAGHLSSKVFGKIKSLWSAQTSTFNLGLNQFAGRTFYSLPL